MHVSESGGGPAVTIPGRFEDEACRARLGDLRRVIRDYGRTEANTFPRGQHYRGGPYGADVNMPVPTDELNNPNFKGCIDRKA